MPHITNHTAVSAKSKTHQVKSAGEHRYLVTSGASGEQYTVVLFPLATCTCNWAKYRPMGTPSGCSHVQAVIRAMARGEGYSVTSRPITQDVSHLHRATRVFGDGVKFTYRKN